MYKVSVCDFFLAFLVRLTLQIYSRITESLSVGTVYTVPASEGVVWEEMISLCLSSVDLQYIT